MLRYVLPLDPDRNAEHAPVISRDDNPVVVRVMATDADRMIAWHTYHLLSREGTHHV
ncbi:MAG: hypothetical protein H0X37_12605 [Herpetosiphonaceae bacterium]|nr:hypothetical protein [Herpetosiphonaceae bacterium]